MVSDSTPAGSAAKGRAGGTQPGWHIALRILTAMVGGYALTSAVTIVLARTLPGSPLDTAMAATLMSFGIYTAIIVWVFAARKILAVTGQVLGLTAVTGLLAWLLRAGAAS